jgi:hypothetical protein
MNIHISRKVWSNTIFLFEMEVVLYIFFFFRNYVSRVRALSPAWTGSHERETLISRTHLFLPPTKKSGTIKSWPTFCDQYFWKFPIWNSRADDKRRERALALWYHFINMYLLKTSTDLTTVSIGILKHYTKSYLEQELT